MNLCCHQIKFLVFSICVLWCRYWNRNVWVLKVPFIYALCLHSTKPVSSISGQLMPGLCVSSLLWWPTASFVQLLPRLVSPALLLLLQIKHILITLLSGKHTWARERSVVLFVPQRLISGPNWIIRPFIHFLLLIWDRFAVAASIAACSRPRSRPQCLPAPPGGPGDVITPLRASLNLCPLGHL